MRRRANQIALRHLHVAINFLTFAFVKDGKNNGFWVDESAWPVTIQELNDDQVLRGVASNDAEIRPLPNHDFIAFGVDSAGVHSTVTLYSNRPRRLSGSAFGRRCSGVPVRLLGVPGGDPELPRADAARDAHAPRAPPARGPQAAP